MLMRLAHILGLVNVNVLSTGVRWHHVSFAPLLTKILAADGRCTDVHGRVRARKIVATETKNNVL